MYLAFEYKHNPDTTTGQPNSYTGRHSIAGKLRIFRQQDNRDTWVSNVGSRRSVTKKEARRLCAGMSNIEFDNYLVDLETLG